MVSTLIPPLSSVNPFPIPFPFNLLRLFALFFTLLLHHFTTALILCLVIATTPGRLGVWAAITPRNIYYDHSYAPHPTLLWL
jgi:hypothetical protein